MPAIAKLVVALGASTANFETDMKRAARISDAQMKKMERQAKRLNDQWNRNFKMAGAAVAGGMVLATKAALDFESSMAEVSTLIDGSTVKSMGRLSDTVKKMSVEFGQVPTDTAKALYDIISAGASDSATQVEQLTAANKLAVGGLTDVATGADLLTTAVNAYSESGLTAQEAIDGLFTTVKQGKTTIPELAASFGQVATVAASVGVSFDELNALTGTLTKGGIQTSEAFSSLKGVFAAILKQSPQSLKAASDLGIQFKILKGEGEGVTGLFRRIAESGATNEQLVKMFGRVEALTGAMKVLSGGGEEYTRQLEAQVNKMGAADAAFNKMADSTKFMAAQAKAAIQIIAVEFGERLLGSVQGASTLMINNIEAVIKVIENLVALIVTRLGIAAVVAMNAAATAANRMAVAMAIVGGPLGALAIGIALLVTNLDTLQKMQNPVGDFIRLLSRGFIILGGVIQAVAVEILNLAMIVINTLRGMTAPLTAFISSITTATAALLNQDLSGAGSALMGGLAKIKTEFVDAANSVNAGLKSIGSGAKFMTEAWDKAAGMFVESSEEVEESAEDLSKSANQAADSNDNLADSVNQVTKALTKSRKAYADMQAQRKYNLRIQESNRLIAEAVQWMDELEAAQRRYEDSLRSILDAADPVAAAMTQLNEEVSILERAYSEGTITLEQYADALEHVAQKFGNATQSASQTREEVDLLTIAIDESVRIMQRVGQRFWEGFLSGAESVFDSIKDGFRSLISNLQNQASTQKITLGIQQGFASGFNQQNLKMIGEGIASFAAVILGSKLGGGGEAANTGAAAGALVGAIAASYIPGIGTAIGSAIGGILGGLLGGIFDKKPRIGAGGFNIEPGDTKAFQSAFGDIFVGDTKGGMDDFVDEFGQALVEFDNTVASFLGDDQNAMAAISDALKVWSSELKGDAVSIENLIRSRFTAILSTFDESIRTFVNQASDIAKQVERLQVATSAQRLMEDQPDLFTGRTLNDFLAVVEGFQSGTETLAEAFNEVLDLLNVIVAATSALRDFADSDLGNDFRAMVDLANLSLTEALAGMTSALDDAIRDFDGSPEALQNIAFMVSTVREGEIKLLSTIDDIQRGINSNLDKLKADILGLTAPAKTGEDLFNDARALRDAISAAGSAEEIAALERQFDAIIRAIGPEDATRNQAGILALIESFRTESDSALNTLAQAVIDSGADARAMVDQFLLTLGDPLEIIANSNEEIRDILSGQTADISDEQLAHQDRTEEILEGGVDNIAAEVANLGPAIQTAIQRGFTGANVQVIIQPASSGLVTQ